MRRDLGDGFELDDDAGRIDVAAVHRYLSEESYWARGRPCEAVERHVREAARVVGLYHAGRQVGFCRAFGAGGAGTLHLADVYVLAGYRGRGLGLELVREMVDGGLLAERAWLLRTADAHDLYRKLGFRRPAEREADYRLMERPSRSTSQASDSG